MQKRLEFFRPSLITLYTLFEHTFFRHVTHQCGVFNMSDKEWSPSNRDLSEGACHIHPATSIPQSDKQTPWLTSLYPHPSLHPYTSLSFLLHSSCLTYLLVPRIEIINDFFLSHWVVCIHLTLKSDTVRYKSVKGDRAVRCIMSRGPHPAILPSYLALGLTT